MKIYQLIFGCVLAFMLFCAEASAGPVLWSMNGTGCRPQAGQAVANNTITIGGYWMKLGNPGQANLAGFFCPVTVQHNAVLAILGITAWAEDEYGGAANCAAPYNTTVADLFRVHKTTGEIEFIIGNGCAGTN